MKPLTKLFFLSVWNSSRMVSWRDSIHSKVVLEWSLTEVENIDGVEWVVCKNHHNLYDSGGHMKMKKTCNHVLVLKFVALLYLWLSGLALYKWSQPQILNSLKISILTYFLLINNSAPYSILHQNLSGKMKYVCTWLTSWDVMFLGV